MKEATFNFVNKHNLNKRFFMFIMGILISAISFNLFYKPFSVIPTGSGGLALILSKYIPISISFILFFVNFILFLVGFIFYGYEYGFKYFLITLIYPIFLSATLLFTKYIDLGNTSLFLVMVLGGISMGFSSGLIRNSGFNPGGFAVLFDILHDKLYISLGMASNIVNFILIGISGFIFGFDKAVYAVISMMISSYVVDRVVIGISDNKVFYIITDNYSEIRDFIIDKLHYSVTVLKGRGGYKNKKKKILMCVVPTIEYINLRNLVREIDPGAFFLIVDTYDCSIRKNCKNL